MHSTAKLLLRSFQGELIFLENPCTFLKQPKVWTFWEMLVFQLNSTAKLLPQANFYNFKISVRKTHFFILKKPEVWTFWGLLQFQLILRQACCLCHFKRLQFFSRKTEVFFDTSKSQNLNVLRNLTNSFALYSKFVTISDFRKIQGFFGKLIFFCKKHNFWTFWEISLLRSHSISNWLTVSVAVDIKLAKLSCFQNFRFFLKKPSTFSEPNFSNNPNNSVDFAQVCYL